MNPSTTPYHAEAEETQHAQRDVVTVFVGLMLGMLVAAVSQTIVAPAMPRIVAELGGIEHYSWIATSAMLASMVVVPIVGKLSDLYGRKPFYVGGIGFFMVGSLLSAAAPNFWSLVAARAVQGIGMGTMMPLSQAIIGDIVSPRERGKYQGPMGAVFGLASIVGPLAGGYITDNLHWRWLFLVNIPFGILALGFIIPFMHLPHIKRPHAIDYWGIVTLSLGLTATLLATIWGGTQYPWGSPQILGLYAGGFLLLGLFVFAETRVVEPVLPLRLWRNSIFTFANIANMAIAMAMFGSIFFIPVFIQGVIGNNATSSGAILIPMTLSMIGMSVATGLFITRTGRYKALLLGGIVVMAVGFYLLTGMGVQTTNAEVVRDMILVGLGLGISMQTYVLVVQNAVSRQDLGVATATTQLFRSLGATLGIALLGTVMVQGMLREIPKHLPADALALMQSSGQISRLGAAFTPDSTANLPPQVLVGIRLGLADALRPVFAAGLPVMAIAFLATLFMKELPLRQSVRSSPDGSSDHRAGDGRKEAETAAQYRSP